VVIIKARRSFVVLLHIYIYIYIYSYVRRPYKGTVLQRAPKSLELMWLQLECDWEVLMWLYLALSAIGRYSWTRRNPLRWLPTPLRKEELTLGTSPELQRQGRACLR
jgi:hypothetical protein